MKKNLVPLLAISVVVALITTAIFYALISAKMTGSVQAGTGRSGAPPPDPRLQAAAELGVPSGMRAVSVQVADSSGVLSVLKPGHRVDVQAVHTRSQNQFDVELKTVLQNLEVLAELGQLRAKHPEPTTTARPSTIAGTFRAGAVDPAAHATEVSAQNLFVRAYIIEHK